MNYQRIFLATILLAIMNFAAAEKRELQNNVMDTVTAGTGGPDWTDEVNHTAGGTIVANGSTATVNESSEVSLDNDAQAAARGVNIVNASSSLVAQGLNISDGQFQNSQLEVVPTVDQSNMIMQSATTRSATAMGYQRDQGSMESSTLSDTANNTDTIDLDSDVMVDTSHTVLGQNVNVGLGVGVAGRVDIDLGPVEMGVNLEAESTVTVTANVTGEVDLPWPLGSMTSTGLVETTMTNQGMFNVNVNTPAISIDAIGSVCYTKLGVCNASSDDNSTYVTNTTHDESYTLDTQGALSVDSMQAEYIVIDESVLEIVSGNNLQLASGAQSNLAAVNAVNAVGSMVANGLNVARNSHDGSDVAMQMELSQRNVVMQGM